jgi:hypothetical protein
MNGMGETRRSWIERISLVGLGVAAGGYALPAMRSRMTTAKVPSILKSSHGQRVALSLGELQRRARKARSNGHSLPEELETLGGIRTIEAFASDKSGDVILLATVDEGRPKLHIDDLTVAFRSAYRVDGIYHEPPGCTIDPRYSDGNSDPWTIQDVKILGQPGDCRMASRHVALDYELKRVGAALVALPGVSTAFDAQRRGTAACGKASSEPTEVTSRFWFCSKYFTDGPRYSTSSEGLTIDHPIGVQVQTERMLQNGGRGSGADPEAERFASEVSQLIASDTRTEYQEIVNDFRLIEVASLARHENVPTSALSYFVEEHELAKVEVPRYVTGIRRTETSEIVAEGKIVVEEGGIRASLPQCSRTLSYRGGVEAVIEMTPSSFRRGSSGLSVITSAIAGRPTANALVWVVPT